MENPIIQNFNNKFLTKKLTHPSFRPGDTLRVHYKLEESTKSSGKEKKYRIQAFEGVCIRYKKSQLHPTFSVRKVASNNIGVERNFPLDSPLIERIDILSAGCVRRARLYYLRSLKGRAARIATRILPPGSILSTIGSETSPKKKKPAKKNKS